MNSRDPLLTQISNLSSLEWLDAGSNAFTGTIPSQVGLLSYLKRLHLFDNQISGSVPTKIASLSNLVSMALLSSQLTGYFLVHLSLLRTNESLRCLRIAGNSLTGLVPESLCSLGQFNTSNEVSTMGVAGTHPDEWQELVFGCNEQLCGCDWCPCT